VLLLGAWKLVPRVSGVFHDDAIYVITGKALADGDGYRLINLPDAPRQTKYPILYPAVLALIWKIWPTFPDNLAAMQWLSILSAAAALALSYLYLVRFGYCSRLTASLAVVLAAATPPFLYLATLTLSEMPFALLAVIALWRAEAAIRSGTGTRVSQLITGVLLGAPYLCRTIGLTLIVAGIGLLGWRRKPMLWTLVGTTAVVAPWMLWAYTPSVSWHDNPIIGYYTDYAAGWSPFTREGFRVGLLNVIFLSRDTAGLALSAAGAGLTALGVGSTTYLFLLGALAWVYIARRAFRGELLSLFLVLYASLMCLWPWPPWRFLVPILPFLISRLASAVAEVARRLLGQDRQRYVLAAAGILAVLGNLWIVAGAARASHRDGYPYSFPPELLSMAPVSWNSFEDLFRWVRSDVGESEIVASGVDTMMALYTQRQTFRPWVFRPVDQRYGGTGSAIGTAEELLDILKTQHARYLVNAPTASKPFERLVDEVSKAHPEIFVPVYRGTDPRFTVFEIRWGAGPARFD
jgi:hypothetical protein